MSVQTYNSNRKGNSVIIYGQDGNEAARVIYSPDKPLKSGATVWIETKGIVEVEPTEDQSARCIRIGDQKQAVRT